MAYCIHYHYNDYEDWCTWGYDLSNCCKYCFGYYAEEDYEANIADYMNDYERDLIEIY